MIIERKRIRPHAVGVALFGALLVAACETDNVTDLTEDRPVLKVVLAPGDAVFPSGSVELSKAVVSGFDLSVPDGFDRGTGPGGFFGGVVTASGTASGVDLGGSVRNSVQDPRLPALRESSAGVGGHFGLFELNGLLAQDVPVGFWDLWGEVQGLEPATLYTVVLARMTLQVNGELDQNQVLTGNAADQPDELSFLAGETVIYENVACDFDIPAGITPISAEMNPVALGVIETDAGGNAVVDCVLRAVPGDQWPGRAEGADLSTAEDFTSENTPFGSNEPGASVGAGQFNYLLLYEGAPTGDAIPSGSPTVRMQLGPDIDASGNVINNAMAPFPTGPVPNAPELSGGMNAFAAPGQIDVTLTGFSPLSGGSYQLWMHNAGSGSYAAVDATIYPDGDMDMMMMGSTFSPSSSEGVYHAKMEASMDLNFGDFTHVAVSAESGQSGSPSGGPFLFQEYLTSANLMQQGAMTFGHLDSDGEIEPFSGGGSGSASFYENSLLVELNRIPSPPPGLHYQSYLVSFTGPGGHQLRTRQHHHAGRPRKRGGQAGGCRSGFVRFVQHLPACSGAGRHPVHHRYARSAERRLQEQVQGVLRRLTPAPACRHNSRPPPVQVAGAFVAGSSSIGRRCPRTCAR